MSYLKYVKEEFKAKQFVDEIGLLNDKISGFKHNGNILTVYLSTVITPQDKVDLDAFVEAHIAQPVYDLRIYRVLDPGSNPLISDFSILGFRKTAPHYDRGRKIKAEYWCVEKDEVIVEKIFKDVRDEETGRLIALQVTFNWYDENNQIGLTKTEIVKELNKAQAETIERQRRERSIDFLISEARYTENEPYVTMLMLHYETEINHYKSKAANDFNTAMENESDPTILAILSSRVPFASDHSYTVPIKESIQYQICALDEASLLATLELA